MISLPIKSRILAVSSCFESEVLTLPNLFLMPDYLQSNMLHYILWGKTT